MTFLNRNNGARMGGFFDVEVSTHYLPIKGGRIMGFLRDITKRKQTEKWLEEKTRLSKILLDAFPCIALLLRPGTREIVASNQFAANVGAVPGFKCFATWGKRKTPCPWCLAPRLWETGKIQHAVVEGLDVVWEAHWIPVSEDLYMHYAFDITERKRAEEALLGEKERLAVTLFSIGDGVITTDISGNVVLINRVAEELCGWTQEDACGKPVSTVFKIIAGLDKIPCENPVDKVLKTGKVITILEDHTLLVSRDGTERVIADSGAPIKNRENETIGAVLVFSDITEKKKMQDAISRTQKLESLGILAGGIAHDFNNLMAGIFGYIELAERMSDKEKRSEYLGKAMNTMDRARGLTAQLLTFAKGGAPMQKVTTLTPFLEETVQFALSGSNCSARFEIPTNLWSCNIDKNQIAQVMDNIVINAQQAMPDGGIIEIAAKNITLGDKGHIFLPEGDFVKISVRDSGIGMSKDMLPRIFDPFYTTKAMGHGLGLTTSHSIINRHGGVIDVDSTPGAGSTFHIYLPAVKGSAVQTDAGLVKYSGGKGTVLVMDDEAVIRETARAMLELLGYTVVCKGNGRDAVNFFKEETAAKRSVSFIIFDLTVQGGMGGKEAVQEVRKIDIDIPVFVMSGYADDPVMKNPSEYGFTSSLCKPFMMRGLTKMLEGHLKQE